MVKTPDVTVVIDPGISIMHRSFPADVSKKIEWQASGERAIKKVCGKANIIVVSHYHYDHYFPDDMDLYEEKLLLTKNPNEYINRSQRRRAEEFFSKLCKHFGKIKLHELTTKSKKKKFGNPLAELPLAMAMDFGDYNQRRKQLLDKNLKSFKGQVKKWKKQARIPEIKFDNLEVKYPEGQTFEFGETKLRFTQAIFHGLEFADVGWIFATVIEHGGKKFIHTSDISGPVIEDYTDWLIQEKPNILIVDGPMTYMVGYIVNKTNMTRAIDNMTRLVKESASEVIIFDHHLPREPKFKENTKVVWDTADELGKKVLTAAEYLGKTPAVLRDYE
ncbi:hypothetical protein [[Eubacterium] cellulosolvens]